MGKSSATRFAATTVLLEDRNFNCLTIAVVKIGVRQCSSLFNVVIEMRLTEIMTQILVHVIDCPSHNKRTTLFQCKHPSKLQLVFLDNFNENEALFRVCHGSSKVQSSKV